MPRFDIKEGLLGGVGALRTASLAALSVLTVVLMVTSAAHASSGVVIHNRYGLPITVDGQLVDRFPASVRPGSYVCVVHQVFYLTSERRLVFRGWSSGETSPCLTATSGTLEALYEEQVLAVVDSNYEPVRRSMWVKRGERVVLEVERVYVDRGYRYVFSRWSRGENPFEPANAIVAMDPIYVDVRFVKEVRIDVISHFGVPVNGSGWYREDEPVVISAPGEIMLGPDEKLVFREWTTVGLYPAVIYSPGSRVTTLEARAPHVIRAEYDRYLRVNVEGPQGVIVGGWFKEGERVQVSAPPVIEVIPNAVRLVFVGWEGDIAASVPNVAFTVTKPLSAKANYRLEYRVEVRSPVGAAGTGWYPANTTATIRVPTEMQAFLFAKRVLSHFTGDCGEDCRVGGLLRLYVDSPKYVEAVYRIEPDIQSIIAAGAVVGTVVVAYFAIERIRRRREVIRISFEDMEEPKKVESP